MYCVSINKDANHLRVIEGKRRKKMKIEKRRQNEDKRLNFHLHSTLCLPTGVHKILKH